jgi:hypothetical protein
MLNMHVRRVGPRLLLALGLAVLVAGTCAPSARAAPVFNEVHTIAAASTGVPVEETFQISTAGTYTITLTDLGAALTPPAPLASVKFAVTNSSNALVGSVQVGAGTLTLSGLTPGSYQIHVVGTPGNTAGSGPIGIQMQGPGGYSESFQDALALPSQRLPNGEAVLDSSFMVSTTGNYNLTLTDLQLPQSLATATLLLIQAGGQTPVATLATPGSTQVSLTAGVTYDIFAIGQAGTSGGGLFSAVVAPSGGGSVVFGRAIPVGSTQLVGSPSLMAGTDTLALADLKFPQALSQLEAVLTLNGQSVVSLAAPGSQPFTATVGTYAVFAVGTATTTGASAGSYAVQIHPAAGAALFNVARAISGPSSTLTPYNFDGTIGSAGTYTASLTDFQFPLPLAALQLAVVQGASVLGTSTQTGGNPLTSADITAAAGPFSVVTFAQAGGGTAEGLFGVDVSASGAATPALAVTQAVGGLFTARQISITQAGNYSVTATDLGFPANFANFDSIVTQGTKNVGSIFGGGTFNFQATAGNYFLNFIAQTSGSDQAGTYALTVAPAPAAPTVTLSVDKPQVASGSTVDLIWSSTNATSCTASGGWSGSQPVSGTATSAALTSNTTFTLTCMGAGNQSASQSVSVTISTSSGGGGGAAGGALVAALAGVVLGRLRRSRSAPTPGRRARCRLTRGRWGGASHARHGSDIESPQPTLTDREHFP